MPAGIIRRRKWTLKPRLRAGDKLFYATQMAPDWSIPIIRMAQVRGLFLKKFRKLGCVDYNGEWRVHNSLLNAVLHD